jgi:DNA-binding FrmR family transcriptional regulator
MLLTEVISLYYPLPLDTILGMSTQHIHETHPDIIRRLKRVEGHLRRVIAMIEEGRTCLDLAQQLHAVEKAVGQAKKTLIHDHVDHCLDAAANGRGGPTRTVVSEFKAISKYL